jgi:N-acetylglutamate synthase-like GNAT family acetyltransferase
MNEASKHNIIIEEADDVGLMRVKRFFRQQGMRPQAAKSDRVFMAIRDGKLVAALRLCAYDDAWVLRSMCVESSLRGQGIGSRLLSLLADVFAETRCYCFAYNHLQAFYQRADFKLIEVETTAHSIAERFNRYKASGKKICLMQYAAE